MKRLALALLLLPAALDAAPRKKPAKAPPKDKEPPAAVEVTTAEKPGSKEKVFDFAAMGIEGRVLAPQLLYMLGRIKVELERGGLEKRSFIPELVRSVDEGGI